MGLYTTMKIRQQIPALLLAMWLGLGLIQHSFAADPIQYRVIIQVSEDSVARMLQALNSARRLQKEFGAVNIDISIVVLAGGVQTLRQLSPFPVPDLVTEAKTQGIRIVADQQAMEKAHLTPKDMLIEVRYVKSGLVDIIEKQQQGWMYLRP